MQGDDGRRRLVDRQRQVAGEDDHAAAPGVLGDDAGEQLDAALARVGMASRKTAPVRTLSQGQRRRVALARLALPGTAALWLLDEPFDALDAGGVEILNALLVGHARSGGGVVLTSHLPLTIAEPRPTTISLDAMASA